MTQSSLPKGIQLGRILAGESHMDVVYFLAMPFRGRDAIKIGTSTRLKARISSVSYAAEFDDVLLLVPGGHDVETMFHDRFSEYRIPPYAELFWREGRLAGFLATAPPVSFATAFAARIRRTFTKNRKAKPEPEYKPRPRPAPVPAPSPEPALPPAPAPAPDASMPMSLLEITKAFLLPRGTDAEQRKRTQVLRQDRYRSDKGELPVGLEFPEPVAVRVDGWRTELYVPSQVIEFNTARRGAPARR